MVKWKKYIVQTGRNILLLIMYVAFLEDNFIFVDNLILPLGHKVHSLKL